MNLGTCCFEGFATKMKLVSYNRIDGKPTRTIEETEQHFTLTRDGRIRVWNICCARTEGNT